MKAEIARVNLSNEKNLSRSDSAPNLTNISGASEDITILTQNIGQLDHDLQIAHQEIENLNQENTHLLRELAASNEKCQQYKKLYLTSLNLKQVTITDVTAFAGETAYLPCDISIDNARDGVLLVLWYREDLGTPIFSVDGRERDFAVAERWSAEGIFASRAYFLPERTPALLAVDRIRASDEGLYRCRVDFRVAQSRNDRVNLTVIAPDVSVTLQPPLSRVDWTTADISLPWTTAAATSPKRRVLHISRVPPSQLTITDVNGDEKKTVVGPFLEGDSLTLRCNVYGGQPTPWIKWYKNDEEVPSDYETKLRPAKSSKNSATPVKARATFELERLGRDDVLSTLTCKSGNNDRSAALEAVLRVDMNLSPLNVHILGANQPLNAGRRYDLLCQSSGSRPPASITWWKNGQRLDKTRETMSTDGNTTTSTVSIVAQLSDANQYLCCKAENPALGLQPLEHGWTLDIQYMPDINISLGTNLNPDNIREGSDVYFDCSIKAHPYVYKVEWRHNGVTLNHNVGKGVIISNQSLVLQGVGRHTAGNYSCVAHNAVGTSESDPFHLDVLFAPTCKPNQVRVHGVAKQENAQIRCEVDANPPDVQFRWTFNNTAESMEVSSGHVNRAGTSSVVTYTPLTELDYGTLLCWASNRIGHQRVPCVYHIIAAGRPDQVHNCSIMNTSMTSFTIRCTEGFNGGLPQSFILEVRESHSQELKINMTSPVPRFTAAVLNPGKVYIAAISAFNVKGRSEPTVVQVTTLHPPEKQLTTDREIHKNLIKLSPAVSMAIGGIAAVLIVAGILVVALKNRCGKCKGRSGHKNDGRGSPSGGFGAIAALDSPCGGSNKTGNSPGKVSNSGFNEVAESDERNPDIIPDQLDSDTQVDFSHKRQHISTIDSSSPSQSLLQCLPPTTMPPNIPGYGMVSAGYYPVMRNRPPNLQDPNPSNPAGPAQNGFMNSVPVGWNYASATCTLPRGGTHWPSYGGTIAGVRPIPPPQSFSGIPLQHLSHRTLPRRTATITQGIPEEISLISQRDPQTSSSQQSRGSPNQRLMRKMSHPSLLDENINITSATPLMSRDKTESTV